MLNTWLAKCLLLDFWGKKLSVQGPFLQSFLGAYLNCSKTVFHNTQSQFCTHFAVTLTFTADWPEGPQWAHPLLLIGTETLLLSSLAPSFSLCRYLSLSVSLIQIICFMTVVIAVLSLYSGKHFGGLIPKEIVANPIFHGSQGDSCFSHFSWKLQNCDLSRSLIILPQH